MTVNSSREPLRFIDRALGQEVVQILPGHVYVSSHNELLSTVLGSCISICIYEPISRLGGMNHYLLPEGRPEIAGSQQASRYGNYATSTLIALLVDSGASPTNLEASVFGGGSMFSSEQDVGQRNIEFALTYLEKRRVHIKSQDVGQPFSRRIRFNPSNGKAMVRRMPTLQKSENGRLSSLNTDSSWRLCG